MNGFGIRFTPEAASCLRKYHPDNKKIIKLALDALAVSPFEGHELQGELADFRSQRIKRYRIIYRIDEEERILQVYHVGHRKDVCEQFRRLINHLRKE